MAAKYPQPDGRSIAPRKWSVDKLSGPLVLLCERMLKKLIQHGWAARYEIQPTNRTLAVRAVWFNEVGETIGFCEAVERAAFIVARSFNVRIALSGVVMELVGEYVVRLRWQDGKVKAATIHPAPDCPC